MCLKLNTCNNATKVFKIGLTVLTKPQTSRALARSITVRSTEQALPTDVSLNVQGYKCKSFNTCSTMYAFYSMYLGIYALIEYFDSLMF